MKKIIFALILLCSSVYAEHEDAQSMFVWRSLPAVCGAPADVEKYIELNDFEAVSVSLGRASSQPDGEPVYMVTFYANDRQESLARVDIPDGTESCILYHTFNTSIVPKKNNL
jgi:hypothetical protein